MFNEVTTFHDLFCSTTNPGYSLIKKHLLMNNKRHIINPFTAPAGNISGLKDARTRLQTGYAISFDENTFTCQCEKGDRIALGF